jgi:hypothetical protein
MLTPIPEINNTASSNNGDSTIQTGNTSSTTSVTNQNIDTNNANIVACGCESASSTTISGNGAGSANNALTTNSTSTIISQNNTAIIFNNIHVSANTGNNNACYNNGLSMIITGSIYASTDVDNKNINNSQYKRIAASW